MFVLRKVHVTYTPYIVAYIIKDEMQAAIPLRFGFIGDLHLTENEIRD